MTLLDDAVETVRDSSAIEPPPSANVVYVVGKLSQPLQTKDLPSGDVLGRWNLVVARPKPVELVNPVEPGALEPADDGEVPAADAAKAAPRRRQSHDTLDCVSFDRDLVERLEQVEPGAWLEVHGALRRRFRGGPEGRQSSYSVEAFSVAVVWTPPAGGDGDAVGETAEPSAE